MLDGLLHTANGELFKAASDSVRQKLNADPPALPPEVFEVCFDLLRQLGDWSNDPVRLAGGLEEIIGGVYKRGGWEREHVFVQQREIFQKLMSPLRSRLRSISVPIVLLVMKKGDAARLNDGTAFDALPPDLQAALREDFASFQKGLADDWAARYGDTPDAWHPFEAGGPTIGQMVRQALGQVEGCPDPLLPKYIDLCSLADNAKLTKDLRKGCVLIIDTVSTRYPALQQCFRSSSLDASGMTLVVKVGPNATPGKVAADMKTVVKLWFESSFDWRLREFDSRVAGVNDRFALDSWLVRELPQCLPKCMARTSGVWGQLNQF
jgi:hypothetical protein